MPEIEQMAVAQNMSVEECIGGLRNAYDGYHFSMIQRGVITRSV